MIRDHKIAVSLWVCAGAVLIMILIGGATRLTDSGLSMVNWHPITGILPPMNAEAWQTLFKDYQRFPEYKHVNQGMTILEFKSIFWLEFIHRVWGRLLGLFLLIPTILVCGKGILRQTWWAVGSLWVLGACQGGMGWYMVKSGLINDPQVSPFRLTVHLYLAIAILGVMAWTAFSLKAPQLSFFKSQKGGPLMNGNKKTTYPLMVMLILLAIVVGTIGFGGLVAGTRAGYLYNTFPLMDGQWIPDEVWENPLSFSRFFFVPGAIQWGHRVFALITMLVGGGVYALVRMHYKMAEPFFRPVLFALAGQICLGIATILYQVPFWGALLHQGMGVVLFLTVLRATYVVYAPEKVL